MRDAEKAKLEFLDVRDDEWTWNRNMAFLEGATADSSFAIPVYLHASSRGPRRRHALISAFLSSSPNSVGLSVLATEVGYLMAKGADMVWRPDGNLLAVGGSRAPPRTTTMEGAGQDVLQALMDCC